MTYSPAMKAEQFALFKAERKARKAARARVRKVRERKRAKMKGAKP